MSATLPVPARDDGGPSHTATALTLIVAALAALGVVLVYSSTSVGIALKAHDATLYLRRQLLWVFLAAGTFLLARTTDPEWLRRRAWWLLGGAIAGLVLVLIPGVGAKVNGARRWIRVAGFNGQPSELAKLALIIFCAAHAAGRREQLRTFGGALFPMSVIGLVAGLIAVEPDMGTALLVSTVATALLLVGGLRVRHLVLMGLPGLLGLLVFAARKLDYIWHRVNAFMDPTADPGGVAYQTRQAVIALGSGGLTGVGLGEGRQKMLFLPDVHTDFIFALVGEELGFVGGAAVLFMFALLVMHGMRAVDRARDQFSFLLALGITLTLAIQSLLNVAVATASVPPKGIALPFVSFGGSHLLAAALAAGLLTRVAADGREPCESSCFLRRPRADSQEEVLVS